MKLEEAIKTSKFTNEKHKAMLNVMYTAWWLKTIVNRELKNFGLTSEQYNVLRILNGKYPEKLCVKNIACRMIERSSNVPRIIDRLEVKKLVKRSTSGIDKRETVVELTAAGINILKLATLEVDKASENNTLLSEEECRVLNNLLDKMKIGTS
jgi:DNA-binding MarR family transcriptional regulator